MQQPSLRRILVALSPLALVIALAAGTFFTSSADARPSQETFWHYYSDDTYQVEVGTKWLTCSGSSGFVGEKTGYIEIEINPCW